MANAQVVDTLRKEFGSREFQEAIRTVLRFWLTYGENTVSAFAEPSESPATIDEIREVYFARFYIDSFFDRVRLQAKFFGWTDALVTEVVEMGRIRFFLEKVMPLSFVSDIAATSAPNQQAFWKRIYEDSSQ